MHQVGYSIFTSDTLYPGPSIVPYDEHLPRIVYSRLEEAQAVAKEWIQGFDEHRLALYGSAYPFENTTLEKELDAKGYAIVGWAKPSEDDEEEEPTTFTVYIYRWTLK